MKKAEKEFKCVLREFGVSSRAADELWKWFDFSEKKGAASF